MKKALLNLRRVTGAFAPFRAASRDKALIVTYHRFSRRGCEASTSAAAFAEQLEYLRSHYSIVPLSELARRFAEGAPPPRAAAAITIDDGYRDAYEIAFPLLKKYGAPATLFVVTDFLDGKAWLWADKLRHIAFGLPSGRFEIALPGRTLQVEVGDRASRLRAADRVNSELKKLPEEIKAEALEGVAAQLGVRLPGLPPEEFAPITWEQAREMDAAGVEIGSHTVTHPILTRVRPDRLAFELSASRARLRDALGRDADLFCYPNGDYDAAVRDAVIRAGYRAAVTTDAGLNSAGDCAFTLKRVHTERDLAHFIQSTSGFEQVKNRLRRAAIARDRSAAAAVGHADAAG
jgi:peptidoglycan/xylan/chitin deacetylase (PgdA/CDA1 family)